MIGNFLTDTETGEPLDSAGNKLSPSTYQPPKEVMRLFQMVQDSYLTAWRLQHRPWQEFDGLSLLQRTKLDQETFGAFVGAEYVPEHKKWRWKGRKNTARNKLVGILAHMIAGMLYPYVYAYNEENEEDKMTAKVMRILVEDHLKKANYELRFLYMVASALVNPAVFVEVQYVIAFQRIKEKLSNGTFKVTDAVDELLSGLSLNIIPVDELLLGDFFTFDLQRQPFIVRVRRIPYDEARKIYSKKYYDTDVLGEKKDRFDYVEKGKTRIFMAGQEFQTLYDIEWTEADRNYVQEITAFYRPEDLQVTFVGGVFMGNYEDVWNSNPFKHRRMTLSGDKWVSMPVYPFAKSGFEPLDPYGRFAYYKSGAFKEYWDDQWFNTMNKLFHDGTYLDVIKPLITSGAGKFDSTVMVPGAVVSMPTGATVNPYSLGPNLVGAMNAIALAEKDLSESTQDKIMSGVTEKGVTAYATAKAEQNARVFLGVFGIMMGDLIKQVGALVVDCIVQHTTVGEIDATVPESIKVKFKTYITKSKEGVKEMTNTIVFTDSLMGDVTKEDMRKRSIELWQENLGQEDQAKYEVNPYKFARHSFWMYIDPDKIVMKSMGADKLKRNEDFMKLTSQFVYPFVDAEALANEVIEESTDGDPEKFKRKANDNTSQTLLSSIMGNGGGMVNQPAQMPEMAQM